MDMKFDAMAAELLIRQMSGFCSGIQKETIEMFNVVSNSEAWNDNQQKAFQNNIQELTKDLNQALVLAGNYLTMFHQRVMELRG